MKDVILIVGMALTFLFGWFLMEQLDRFLYENQKRIRLDTMEFATFWCYNTIKRGGETVQNNENNLSKEHILVCLSSSPSNERIVRMAGKMAQAFCGSLTALYVQTPGYSGMNAEDIARLQANIRLAQQLGAEIITNTWGGCTNADCGICATLRCDQNRNWAQRRAATAFLERTDVDRTAHYACAGNGHSHHSGCGGL